MEAGLVSTASGTDGASVGSRARGAAIKVGDRSSTEAGAVSVSDFGVVRSGAGEDSGAGAGVEAGAGVWGSAEENSGESTSESLSVCWEEEDAWALDALMFFFSLARI